MCFGCSCTVLAAKQAHAVPDTLGLPQCTETRTTPPVRLNLPILFSLDTLSIDVAIAQARQRAELSATDAEDKLKAQERSAKPCSGEGVQAPGAAADQAKAMADLDASLMQRLDEDSATNHKLLESLRATQVGRHQSVLQISASLCCAMKEGQETCMFVARSLSAGCNDR